MPRPKKPAARKPAARMPAVRGRVPATFTLDRQLLAEIDDLARQENRPRSRMIEIACRAYVQAHQRRPAAA